MALPSGFTVNGVKRDLTKIPVPPVVKRVISMLETLPFKSLLTTREVAMHVGIALSGSWNCHPALEDYCELDGPRKYWGSRKSIAFLRGNTSEEKNGN